MFYKIMATFKALILAHHKKSDGTYNVKIRVTHERKTRYLKTPYHVAKEDVTRALKLKNQIVIDATSQMVKSYRNKTHLLGEKLETLTIQELVEYLKKEKERFSLDFLEYGRKYAQRVIHEEGRKSTGNLYLCALNSLARFLKQDALDIEALSYPLLQDYLAHLNRKHGIGKTACAHAYLKKIKVLFNLARREFNDEDLGIIKIPHNPFKHLIIPKQPPSAKRALSLETIKELKNICFQDPQQQQPPWQKSLDIFMLSFMLVGMNSADLYSCLPPHGAFLTYNRTKTKNKRRDKAEICIKLEPELDLLLQKYKDPTGARAFNFYHHYSSAAAFNCLINNGLKKLGASLNIPKLQFYAARHSWATIAANLAKVDKYTVHEALNHVAPVMSITDVYIKKDFGLIHEANRKVLDLVFKH